MIPRKHTRRLCFIFVGGGGGGSGKQARRCGGGSLQKDPFMATKWA